MQQLLNGAALEGHSFEYFPVTRHYFVPIVTDGVSEAQMTCAKTYS